MLQGNSSEKTTDFPTLVELSAGQFSQWNQGKHSLQQARWP